MDIHKAINYAAGELPEGFHLDIMIENGGWGVDLVSPSGRIRSMEEGSLIDDVIMATDRAKQLGEEGF